ncbi:hypothetical protein HHI36_003307 [Cryptolaemus montrouzieri]|uniref:Acyltransferase 3 domain-containing protein n=1 Tax=Cryptolaemus montrouzieri TaxID=559131 RepID=A0ABD2PEG6_9CUCU
MLLGEKSLYCTIEFQLEPIDPENPTDSWKQIQELGKNPKNYHHDRLRHGICLPFTCPNITIAEVDHSSFREELANCYSKKYENKGMYGTIRKIHCQTNESIPFDSYDTAVIIFILVYLSFIIYASFYEGMARYKTKIQYEQITGTTVGKLLSCFSVPKNFYRLKTVKDTPEVKSLKSIQGIRFFNMSLVILTHCIMSTLVGPVSNPKMAETFTDDFSNIAISAGSHAVQTFFLISAFLLTYHVFLAFENKKELDIKTLFWIFVNRYIRLTPPLAFVLAIHSTLLVHAPKGPFWDHIIGEEYRKCRKNFWTNLLYINNYVNPSEMCMQQTWYMATDTQLFIMALFILAAMKKFKKQIKWILGVTLVIGVSIPGILAFINNYDSIVRGYPEPLYNYLLTVEEWHVLYSAAHSNIGAYIIGIIFGYLYYLYRNVNLINAKIYIVLYYILSYGLALGIIAVAYPMFDSSYSNSNIISALYWSGGKNIFTLGVAIGIFGMTQQLGWFGLWLCRWNPMQSLGRLTYSAYLVHVFLMKIRSAYIRFPVYMSHYNIIISTMGDIAVAYFVAFLLCLSLEMPVTALQKQWLPQKSEEFIKTPQVLVPPKIEIQK